MVVRVSELERGLVVWRRSGPRGQELDWGQAT
jgi:hypothetical protein